ncbi:MAG: hypothetical protein COA80_08555 [Leeuwenhoekiella sp.]|nr:MAG: hypothetical protein COA80_08555 [Leeuwenhoekiella sp.]
MFYITILTFLFYLALIYLGNRIILRKYGNEAFLNKENMQLVYNVLALNFNLVAAIFLTHKWVMNYITFLNAESSETFTLIASTSLVIVTNGILILISYLFAEVIGGMMKRTDLDFLKPVLWITINLCLLHLAVNVYEAYINSNTFSIY